MKLLVSCQLSKMSQQQQQQVRVVHQQIKIEENQCDLCCARVPNQEMLAEHKAAVHGQVCSYQIVSRILITSD